MYLQNRGARKIGVLSTGASDQPSHRLCFNGRGYDFVRQSFVMAAFVGYL